MDTITQRVTRAVSTASEPAKPLFMEITDTGAANIAMAVEIRSRLYNFLDRTFGPQVDDSRQGADPSVPQAFADIAKAQGWTLRDILNEIDSITANLSNRC